MKFSIITASIGRPSLAQCRESFRAQTYPEKEHIIMLDDPPHGDYGNFARNLAWGEATGDYVIVLDDDNLFLRSDALQIIARTLDPMVGVNIYPILRFGHEFSGLPPQVCHVDSANAVFRRDVGPWPIGPEYTMDGIFIERVAKEYGWSSHATAPLISVPIQGKGL